MTGKRLANTSESTWNTRGQHRDIFTDMAVDEIYEYSHGIPRKINRACTACLLHGAQVQKKIIDDYVVRLNVEEELN